MNRIFTVIAVLFSMGAQADVVSYRLYEGSISMMTPFVLSIETDGAFRTGANVTKITLTERLKTSSTLLFSWNQASIAKRFTYKWKSGDILVLGVKDGPSFKAVVKKEVSNGWGDTSINPKDYYSVHIDNPISLSARAVLSKEPRFEISNQTVEESCLWGELTK